jgi:hypothetical protein
MVFILGCRLTSRITGVARRFKDLPPIHTLTRINRERQITAAWILQGYSVGQARSQCQTVNGLINHTAGACILQRNLVIGYHLVVIPYFDKI